MTIKPLSNNLIHSFDFQESVNDVNKRELVLVCELLQDDVQISTCVGTFVPNKHVRYTAPNLSFEMKIEGELCYITISTKSLARFVELKLDGADVVFSDNYFDIPAGRIREITFPSPSGWSLEKAIKALRVYSLYDSF
jgi:beta-mannosidase